MMQEFSDHCSGESVPCSSSSGEEPLPNTQPDLPLTQPHAIPSCPAAVTKKQSSALPLCCRSCSQQRAPPQPPLGWMNKPRDLGLSSYILPYRPFITSVALLRTLERMQMVAFLKMLVLLGPSVLPCSSPTANTHFFFLLLFLPLFLLPTTGAEPNCLNILLQKQENLDLGLIKR